MYFQPWCWSEWSKFQTLLDIVTRVCFWAADSAWGNDVQCLISYPILSTKWYRIVVAGINVLFASCWSDAKGYSLRACRITRAIGSQLSISPSSSADSEEWGNFAFASTWLSLSIPQYLVQEHCWFLRDSRALQDASWRDRAWLIQGPFRPFMSARWSMVICVQNWRLFWYTLDEDAQKLCSWA
jgi:hypothetical protein